MNADSAQPRKASNVTRPFPILWVGSGDETTVRMAMAATHSKKTSEQAIRACANV